MLGFGALGQFALGEVDEGVTETVQYGKWVTLWGEPVRFPNRLHASLNPFESFQIASFPEAVTESRWHQPWSEPKQVRADAQRREFRAELQQTLAFVDWSTSNDIEAEWHQPWSEPKRFPKRIQPGLEQFLAYQPTPIIDIGWFGPFGEPKRFQRGSAVYEQPFYSAEPEPEDVDFMGWWQPFGEPKRFPKGLRKELMPSFTTSAQSFTTPYVRGFVFC